MSRKFIAALVATAGLAFTASAANATVFTLDSFNVAAHSTDAAGLEVEILKLQTTPLTFDLGGGADPQTHDLFLIWTDETSVNNGEDTVAKPISVAFTFSDPFPNVVDPVTGDTVGQRKLFGTFQNGLLTWDGPAQLTWGNGNTGLMTITLNGGQFSNGIGGLNGLPIDLLPNSAFGLKVSATFDWDRDPTGAVPEPATWALMIGGFGLAGAALRRRRTLTAAA